MENKEIKNPSPVTQGLIIALMILVLFFSGNFLGALGGRPDSDATEDTQVEDAMQSTETPVTQAPVTQAPVTQAPTQAPTHTPDYNVQ